MNKKIKQYAPIIMAIGALIILAGCYQAYNPVLAVSAEVVDCSNCADCNEKIQNAAIGDVVRLTANITYNWGTCINFDGKDDVTFDGMGHTIDGARNVGSYGIYLPAHSDNNIIRNCAITDFYDGIYLFKASYNIIENVTSYHNRNTGITIFYSTDNTIRDCSLPENPHYDFYFRPNYITDCNTGVINVTGSGWRPIGFYNQKTSLKDLEFAALYLCDADESTLDNISIIGSSSHSNNGIRMYYTDKATLKDVESSDNFEGISMDDSNDNTIVDGTFNNSWHYNVFLSRCERNLLENITTCWSKQSGVYLYHAPNNVLTGITATSNHIGLKLDNSGSIVIKDSVVTDSLINGLSGGVSVDNLVYNNYFDNTQNLGGSLVCTWNITPTTGTNIIGGPSIGGNYWGGYDGSDADGDGFGDVAYDTGSGIDYHPLVEMPALIDNTTDTLTFDKTSYQLGETVNMYATGSNIGGETWNGKVSFTITQPDGTIHEVTEQWGVSVIAGGSKTVTDNFQLPTTGQSGTWTAQSRWITDAGVIDARSSILGLGEDEEEDNTIWIIGGIAAFLLLLYFAFRKTKR